jgi:hypothetical protein
MDSRPLKSGLRIRMLIGAAHLQRASHSCSIAKLLVYECPSGNSGLRRLARLCLDTVIRARQLILRCLRPAVTFIRQRLSTPSQTSLSHARPGTSANRQRTISALQLGTLDLNVFTAPGPMPVWILSSRLPLRAQRDTTSCRVQAGPTASLTVRSTETEF